MKRFLVVAAMTALVGGGCAYHGAVYSEYSQVALDIRSTAASSAPIKVSFGYDRGVLAYVPKLNGTNGESCSVISWQKIGSTMMPARTGSNSVLRVDAGFISGTAADVASAPDDCKVVILPPRAEEGVQAEKGASYSVETKGGAGERIARAFQPSARFLTESQMKLQQLIDRVLSQSNKETLFEQAARILPPDFNAYYQKARQAGAPARVAFLAAKNRYLEGETTEGPKHDKLIQALQAVLK